ncbi:MAG: hypothetical protein NUW37_09685 [Planctomycetes bacterium]|nr:hypothetical protein [Planctomycetota bacterium]
MRKTKSGKFYRFFLTALICAALTSCFEVRRAEMSLALVSKYEERMQSIDSIDARCEVTYRTTGESSREGSYDLSIMAPHKGEMTLTGANSDDVLFDCSILYPRFNLDLSGSEQKHSGELSPGISVIVNPVGALDISLLCSLWLPRMSDSDLGRVQLVSDESSEEGLFRYGVFVQGRKLGLMTLDSNSADVTSLVLYGSRTGEETEARLVDFVSLGGDYYFPRNVTIERRTDRGRSINQLAFSYVSVNRRYSWSRDATSSAEDEVREESRNDAQTGEPREAGTLHSEMEVPFDERSSQ